MSWNARVTIERLAKEFGGTIAGPDDPIYQEGYQISFMKNSRRPSTTTSNEDSSEPIQDQQPDLAGSSQTDTTSGS